MLRGPIVREFCVDLVADQHQVSWSQIISATACRSSLRITAPVGLLGKLMIRALLSRSPFHEVIRVQAELILPDTGDRYRHAAGRVTHGE
jgi:hypothetical protein